MNNTHIIYSYDGYYFQLLQPYLKEQYSFQLSHVHKHFTSFQLIDCSDFRKNFILILQY
jgi:hypothetical protein